MMAKVWIWQNSMKLLTLICCIHYIWNEEYEYVLIVPINAQEGRFLLGVHTETRVFGWMSTPLNHKLFIWGLSVFFFKKLKPLFIVKKS